MHKEELLATLFSWRQWLYSSATSARERMAKIKKSTTDRQCKAERKRRNSAEYRATQTAQRRAR